MSEWLHLEIPAKTVGETIESGNDYIKTYRTEILLPKDSQYPGYCFQHPSKLVSCGPEFARLTYNDTFVFNLVKKDREPGKRYKRYTLTAAELIAIYAPEVAQLKARLAKKEEKRLAQIGAVEALECRGYHKYYWLVAFSYGKHRFLGDGQKIGFSDEIYKSRLIANDVSRRDFESDYDQLASLCKEFQIIQDMRYALNKSVEPTSSDMTVTIYDSFYSLSDQWEIEFYQKVAKTIENAKTGGCSS